MIIDDTRYSLCDQQYKLNIIHLEHQRQTRLHSHDFYEFVYVEKGFSLHRAEGRTTLILPGDLLAVRPDVGHEYWKSVNNSVFNCVFYPEIFGEDLYALGRLPLLREIFDRAQPKHWCRMHLNAARRQQSLICLKEMEAELAHRQTGWELRAKALLTDFMVGLSRAWDNADEKKENAGGSSAALRGGVIAAAVDSIESDDPEGLNVAKMAKRAGCTPEHFSRSFKKLTGMAPSSFILSMKTARAAERLLDPDCPVSRAAEISGFDDVNYFARVFKKETGLTPSEFKRRNAEKSGYEIF